MFKKISKHFLFLLAGLLVVSIGIGVFIGAVYLLTNIHLPHAENVMAVVVCTAFVIWVFVVLCAAYSIGKDLCRSLFNL